jgi:hypothetical protein
MKDVNYPLRKAYFAALTGITYSGTPVPVYYNELPIELQTTPPAYYIIFSGVSSNDISTKATSDTQTSMSVSVFTKGDLTNGGIACDNIADQVYDAIYPNTQAVLAMTGFQMLSTRLASDNQSHFTIDQSKFVDRTIIFTHKIFHT